jgi:hypothetical protein
MSERMFELDGPTGGEKIGEIMGEASKGKVKQRVYKPKTC